MTQDDTGIIDRGEGYAKNCGFYFKFNEKPLKSFSQKKDIQSEVLKKIALAALSRKDWRLECGSTWPKKEVKVINCCDSGDRECMPN